MRTYWIGLGAGLALIAGVAGGAGSYLGMMNGNRLYELQTSEEVSDQAHALGYTSGVYDALSAIQDFQESGQMVRPFCPPDNANRGQVDAIVNRYLQEHPEQRHNQAAALALFSLMQAFPCAAEGT